MPIALDPRSQQCNKHDIQCVFIVYVFLLLLLFPFLGRFRVQELCESRGGRPGLSVLTSLTVSVDVKQH